MLLLSRGRSPASCKAPGGSTVSQTHGASKVSRASVSRSPQGKTIAVEAPEAADGDKKAYCCSEAAGLFIFFPSPKK